jgi:hypothetical protein
MCIVTFADRVNHYFDSSSEGLNSESESESESESTEISKREFQYQGDCHRIKWSPYRSVSFPSSRRNEGST